MYTIHELLDGRLLAPRKLYCMGGPARAFQTLLAKATGWEVEVPENYQVANAIGAALTQLTTDVELFADTSKGRMLIPSLAVEQTVASDYRLEDAERDALGRLSAWLDAQGVGDRKGLLEITEASSFNMVDETGVSGRNIRVKCQIRPGVIRL